MFLLALILLSSQLCQLIILVDGLPASGMLYLNCCGSLKAVLVDRGVAIFSMPCEAAEATFIKGNLSHHFILKAGVGVLELYTTSIYPVDFNGEPVPPSKVEIANYAAIPLNGRLMLLVERGFHKFTLSYHGVQVNVQRRVEGATFLKVKFPVADLNVKLCSWNGTPVKFKQVKVIAGSMCFQAISDDRGLISLEDVPLGNITIKILDQDLEVSLTHDGSPKTLHLPPKELNVSVSINVDYLMQSAVIEVRVSSPLHGPLKNCTVKLLGSKLHLTEHTDAAGLALFKVRLPPLFTKQVYNLSVVVGDFEYHRELCIEGNPLVASVEFIASIALALIVYICYRRAGEKPYKRGFKEGARRQWLK